MLFIIAFVIGVFFIAKALYALWSDIRWHNDSAGEVVVWDSMVAFIGVLAVLATFHLAAWATGAYDGVGKPAQPVQAFCITVTPAPPEAR